MSELITLTISAVALQVTGVTLAAAASVLTGLIAGRMSAQGRRVLEELTGNLPTTLDSIGPAKPSAATAPLGSHSLSVGEARLVTELASVASLAVGDTRRLQEVLQARPIEQWAGIIRQEHQQVFRQTLTDAISRACRKLEFGTIHPAGDQLVAEDRKGRAIAVQIGEDGKVRAEILGIADGSCHAQLDRFLRTLAEEGVQIAKVNDRRWTGGAPNTNAGRRWAAQKGARLRATQAGNATDRRVKATKNPARIRR
jgi:hypothetical protein